MPSLKDLSSMFGNGERGGQSVELSEEVKEKVMMKIEEARQMVEDEGLDGAQFIMSHLTGKAERADEAAEPEEAEGKDRKKKMMIIALKRKHNGDSET